MSNLIDGQPIEFTLIQTTERDDEGFIRYGYDIVIDGQREGLVVPALDHIDAMLAHELAERGLDINNARWAN